MTFLGRSLVSVCMMGTIALADSVPCRTMSPDTTTCNPYSRAFLQVDTSKKRISTLRNKPIVEKQMPILENIKVRQGITLESLISKYIKREEKRYEKAELKREEEAIQHQLEVEEEQVITPIEKGKSEDSYLRTTRVIKQSKPIVKKEFIQKQPVTKAKGEEKRKIIEKSVADKATPKASKPKESHDEKSYELIEVVDYGNMDKNNKPTKETMLVEDTQKKDMITLNADAMIQETYAVYVVKRGDSLGKIARMFDIDTKEMRRINQLNTKQQLKIKQKLYVPIDQERLDTVERAIYKVKRGDSLSSIAKKFNVKISDLKRYNHIRKKSIIHVGQKLTLPLPHKLAELKRIEAKKKKERLRKKKERERLARIALKKAKKARFLRISKRLKRKLSVTATAYTSHRAQTDSTPFLAAWNNRIRPGMKVIAVSRDLIWKYGITNGSKVRISGLPGIYTVRDKMNKRWRRRIDIYMGTSRWRALRWGRRRVTLHY